MSCCNKNRRRLHNPSQDANMLMATLTNRVPIIVRYLGKDKITVRGTASKKDYHFPEYGARTTIDPLDLPAFKQHLKMEILSKV